MESPTFVWGIVNLWNKKILLSKCWLAFSFLFFVFEKLTLSFRYFWYGYRILDANYLLSRECDCWLFCIQYLTFYRLILIWVTQKLKIWSNLAIFFPLHSKFGHHSDFSFLYGLVQGPKNRKIRCKFCLLNQMTFLNRILLWHSTWKCILRKCVFILLN